MNHISFIPRAEIFRVLESGAARHEKLRLIADICRINALSSIKLAGSGHIGSSLSSMDIFVFLYFEEMNLLRLGVTHPGRDVFYSSKGHDCPGQYAVMAAAGMIDDEKLQQLRRLGGLEGHPEVTTPGIEANTGSLGMGISKGKGIAIAKRLRGDGGRVIVLTGDGELQEGQIWESLQSSAHHGIDNLWAIVDANKVQTDRPVCDVLELKNLEAKVRDFGWTVARCDGHDFSALDAAFRLLKNASGPKMIIADTVKGKGVSFMETIDGGLYKWHSGAPDDDSYERAINEISGRLHAAFDTLGISKPVFRPANPAISTAYPVSTERVVAAYGEALLELGKRREDIVALNADLSADCGTRPFEAAFPGRFIECGISEQDMVSTAGGLALSGFLPIVHSFSVFLASRANEQIYANATENTKIIYVCNYAGVLPAGAGRSHQGVRDASLFGALPNCVIAEPCCADETKQLIEWCADEAKENCMIRLSIFSSPGPVKLPDDYRLTAGRGVMLRDGGDGVIFVYGPVMVFEAVKAAELLANKGFSLRVVNMPWLNRIDAGWLAEAVSGCRAVFALDNHSPHGGLGDSLLNALSETSLIQSRTFRKLAVDDYPVCGLPAEVLAHHHLDAEGIAASVAAATTEGLSPLLTSS
ncbi:MAG: 1-deoxy-D-xylulose-5-phosphate synthase [Nitrospirae bacterium]|nr:1-deoxy-D-xylulose-5-phosphate synthase [Nitrospirota bacterium]